MPKCTLCGENRETEQGQCRTCKIIMDRIWAMCVVIGKEYNRYIAITGIKIGMPKAKKKNAHRHV